MKPLRIIIALLAVGGAGYWLLGNTLRHHAPPTTGPVRVAFWGPYEEFEMWKAMLAEFERRHPDIPTKIEFLPGPRYNEIIQRQIVAQNAPDVILYQDEPYPRMVSRGAFEDLTPYLREHFGLADDQPLTAARLQTIYWDTAVISFGRFEGDGDDRAWHQYGMPTWGGCNLFYYNKRCFERSKVRVVRLTDEQVPDGSSGLVRGDDWWRVDDTRWTIDEFVEVCKRLTIRDADGRAEQYGLSLGGWLYWMPLHLACGGTYLNDELTRLNLDTPGTLRSMQLWQDVVFKYRVTPRAGELGQMNEGVGFLTGRIAMFCSGPWGMPFLNEAKMDYDLLHTPHGSGGPGDGRRGTRITWDAVNIFSGSSKKRQAWALIKYLSGLDDEQHTAQKHVADVQRSIPAKRAVADYFQQRNPNADVSKFVEAARTYARFQPITEHWGVMQSTFGQAFSELRNIDVPAERRITPVAAVGLIYADPKLRLVLPPADEAGAERCLRAYDAWRRGEKVGAGE